MVNKLKAVAYVRTATESEEDECKLNGQMEAIKRYAMKQGIEIVALYEDRGKSGNSVEGRPAFSRMMNDITSEAVKVESVLVSKLFRFGRNATSICESLQNLQNYGVNLICTEDRVNTSEGSSRLLCSFLSVMSELEKDFSYENDMGNSRWFGGGEW